MVDSFTLELLFAGVILLIMCVLVGAWGCSLGWLYQDARERGQSGWFMLFLVGFVTWPFGLLFWLIFRPARKKGLRFRHHWDGSLSCAQCGARLVEENDYCANCQRAPETAGPSLS